MFQKNFKKIFCVIVWFELAVVAALADAPVEQYHVIHDDIAKGVLENTLGILTINSGKNNELKTYLKTGAVFSHQKTLLVIVYDPVENLQAWLNLQDINGFSQDLLMIDSLATKQNSHGFVDVFHFTQNGQRKLYQRPDQNAAYTVISKHARQFRWLKILDQKAGFIQVGTIRYLNDQPKVDPAGWIRIRDDEKRLMIWIVSADNC